MSWNFTEEEIARAEEWWSLTFKEEDIDRCQEVFNQIRIDLGEERSMALCGSIEERYERQKRVASAPKRKGVLKPARRAAVSKSSETWRCLGHYPLYEVSSYGRVRSLNRARPGDWLKPRYRWFKGMCVPSVVIRDSEGRRVERMIGALLIDSGFMKKPGWMKR